MPPPGRQVFANGPLWRAARGAWQPFFKQARARRVGSSAERLAFPHEGSSRSPFSLLPRLEVSLLETSPCPPLQEALDKSGPLMASSASRLCDRLAATADAGAEIDVWRALGSMTLDVVGTSAFGWVGGWWWREGMLGRE